MPTKQQIFLSRLCAYGESSEAIRAIVLTGSCAWDFKPADFSSDIDVLLFVQDMTSFLCTMPCFPWPCFFKRPPPKLPGCGDIPSGRIAARLLSSGFPISNPGRKLDFF